METVSAVEPLIGPNVAVMVVLPVEMLVARPLLLMATAAGFEEAQTTEAETSCAVLSLKVPLAVNCLVVPTAMLEFAGATEIEIKLAPVTVSDAVAFTEPDAAVIETVRRDQFRRTAVSIRGGRRTCRWEIDVAAR